MRRRGGFTLVSVLVAMVLVSIAVVALGFTQAVVAATEARAAHQTHSIAVARAYMEEVRARDPWALRSEAAQRVALDGQPDPAGPLTRSLQVDERAGNLLMLTVRVRGEVRRAPVALVTYVYRGAR